MTTLVPLSAFIAVSGALFFVGVAGVLVRRNAVVILMSVELMLNAANLAFVAFSRRLGIVDERGSVFVIFVFVVAMLGASLFMIYRRGHTTGSRFDRARLRYLALVGALAAVFTILDYLPYVGLHDIPPVGTVLTLVFLYILSQSIVRSRLLDLYELAGRLGVLTALSFTLAGIFLLFHLFHFRQIHW